MVNLMVISVGKIFGGIEKYTLDLINNLPSEKYNIFLVVRKDGVLIKRVRYKNVISLSLDKKDIFASMLKLRRIVKDKKINIIHCNSNNGLLVALLLNKKNKIAVIHGDVVLDQSMKGGLISKLYKVIENILIKTSEVCIAVSKSLETVLDKRGIRNIQVVYNGIEVWKYKNAPDYYNVPLKASCVGNLLPVKNQITLLKAVRYMKEHYPKDRVEFDIYGEGMCRNELQNYIDENKLVNVHLCGFDSDVRTKLPCYQLYVQPSKYESFGIAALEAMNAGCCVLVSNVGGLKEIVDTETGILFDSDDYVALANELHRCYQNRSFIKSIGMAGKRKMETMFTIKKMITETEKIYTEIQN